jgi:hypothetical protein
MVGKIVPTIQQLAKNEEPIFLHVTRNAEAITAELTVAGLKDIVPKAVDVGIEVYYDQMRPMMPAGKPAAVPIQQQPKK